MRPAGLTSVAALAVLTGRPLSAQPTLPTWKLDPTPLVTIGGDGPAEFHRISGVVRLSTGHIAVVNAGTAEIRIFDSRGRYDTTVGREGSGPGEFRMPSYVWRSGDTLRVWDAKLLRVTTVLAGPSPNLLGTLAITALSDRSGYSVRGMTSDSKWLAITSIAPVPKGPTRLYREKSSIGLIGPDGGGEVSWIATLPSASMFLFNPSGEFGPGDYVGYSPFSPTLEAVAVQGATWYGESESDSLMVRHGSQTRVVRLPITRRPPSRSLITAKRAHPQSVPKLLPYYERLVVGDAGEVWVEEYAGLTTLPTRYLVIGADLKPKAWLSVPAGFRIKDVGRDYVAGVHFDQNDVETVRVYRLVR